MIKSSYTEAFKQQAVKKVLQRGGKTIQTIANESNVNYHTLKNWLKTYPPMAMTNEPASKRPEDWSTEERFQLLMACNTLEGEALNTFCRQKGIFSHHLDTWEKAFISSQQTTLRTVPDKALRDEVKQLKKELQRKEKALAEAAALLLLQKKFNAFWEEKAS